jgi:hypothetical protein
MTDKFIRSFRMPIKTNIPGNNGVFFITFTCARWLPLFQLTNGYDIVYRWFDYLKTQRHHIVGYVIMPSHVHVLIAFSSSHRPINTTVGNGKRFMAYALVRRLQTYRYTELLDQMASWVNRTDRSRNKLHEVFERSFDWKECRALWFMKQKVDYIHNNPCKARLVRLPEDYRHSSARYYFTGQQGIYPVITYLELQDIDLS